MPEKKPGESVFCRLTPAAKKNGSFRHIVQYKIHRYNMLMNKRNYRILDLKDKFVDICNHRTDFTIKYGAFQQK